MKKYFHNNKNEEMDLISRIYLNSIKKNVEFPNQRILPLLLTESHQEKLTFQVLSCSFLSSPLLNVDE